MHIALTQRVIDFHGHNTDAIAHDWYRYLAKHQLQLIPNRRDQDLGQILTSNDMLIISGGDRHPVRDYIEYELINMFMRADKPILGICHGFQCLTMHLGGCIEKIDQHMSCGHMVHDIITGNTQWVNSYHTFRISVLPDNVDVLAITDAGDCESWIKGNIGGVMWHPERGVFNWMPQPLQALLSA
jgi:gamma-glutamyl-gamma-aminobutyrate hydrolase PuuD